MADGHLGSHTATSWPITKIFMGFRIALDVKKLVLAAAGIFATYLGWLAICALFYGTSTRPDFQRDYEGQPDGWKYFKRDRDRWNLLHYFAGPPTNDPKKATYPDAGDMAKTKDQFDAFKAVLEGAKLVTIDEAKLQLILDGAPLATFSAPAAADLEFIKTKEAPLAEVVVIKAAAPDGEQAVLFAGKRLVIVSGIEKLAPTDIKPLSALSSADQEAFREALKKRGPLPAGLYRVCPWNENRGTNPYLLTKSVIHGDSRPFGERGFVGWLLHDQLPILVEPVIKFFSPIWYLFDGAAGGFRNRTFLICIIIWNLAVWGYFGGAICRLAALQFARNEKIPLSEAITFVNERCKHFLLAPTFPLVCLFVLTVALGLFGLITGYTYFFGDIVLAGILWPLVLVLGLVMAVLVMGLFAWPLMYPTIAVEGSDSFDALSRSYSYLYQAPWQFICYATTAILYGAAVVFFVGLMGSLAVYLGKWGFSEAPGLASQNPGSDRTPVYLFQHAPASFGWRDLLLHDSPWAQPVDVPPAGVGSSPVHYKLRQEYIDEIGTTNSIGSWMVTFWLGLTFLLVVGFSYSYFWTASTILYFLMRKKVDDTDFDEIYLDEGDVPPPPPPQMKEPIPAPTQKPGTVSLNVVEPPKPPG